MLDLKRVGRVGLVGAATFCSLVFFLQMLVAVPQASAYALTSPITDTSKLAKNKIADHQEILKQAQSAQKASEYKEAFRLYKLLADDGNDFAQFSVGLFYEQGLGVLSSAAHACTYYKMAASKGVPFALQKTGDCLIAGSLALDENAENMDGMVYFGGDRVDESSLSSVQKHAINYYMLADQSGIYSSACLAAEIMLKAQPKTHAPLALDLCLNALNKGAISAAIHLGKWFLQGQYFEQDLDKAEQFFQVAKPNDSKEAAFLLGSVYDNRHQQMRLSTSKDASFSTETSSRSLEKELQTAIYWYETAASMGYEKAYLPTSLLYWQLIENTPNANYLAKTYLWINTAISQYDGHSIDVQQFAESVNQKVPEDWKSTLDTKIESHIARFHSVK